MLALLRNVGAVSDVISPLTLPPLLLPCLPSPTRHLLSACMFRSGVMGVLCRASLLSRSSDAAASCAGAKDSVYQTHWWLWTRGAWLTWLMAILSPPQTRLVFAACLSTPHRLMEASAFPADLALVHSLLLHRLRPGVMGVLFRASLLSRKADASSSCAGDINTLMAVDAGAYRPKLTPPATPQPPRVFVACLSHATICLCFPWLICLLFRPP
jgi:hypothetical protein